MLFDDDGDSEPLMLRQHSCQGNPTIEISI
jgi:hypothetical protein